MIQEIKKHKLAYFVLAVALVVFVVTFMHLWPDRAQQKIVVITMSTFYFFWGILVHKISRHINAKVIFEYLAVSILSASLLLLLLN